MKNKKIVLISFTISIILCFIIINTLPVFTDEKVNKSTITVPKRVEISFLYKKQRGRASNQFAVWIGDSSGKYIKTLYATSFTAEGGFKKRKQSLPEWVKASKLINMSSKEVDAITGSTPSAGRLTYIWDCKNNNGKILPAGEYRYYVEATLRWENRVLYQGNIKIGGPAQQSKATCKIFGDSKEEREMITSVTAKYYP